MGSRVREYLVSLDTRVTPPRGSLDLVGSLRLVDILGSQASAGIRGSVVIRDTLVFQGVVYQGTLAFVGLLEPREQVDSLGSVD